MTKLVKSEAEMKVLGQTIGSLLSGGEVIELIGDVGSGKTTLVKGIAVGLGIEDSVQSPSFTINRVYEGRDNITLIHYDFYRLDDAGIMANELREDITEPCTVTVVEWGKLVEGVLPNDRLTVNITAPAESTREVDMISGGPVSQEIEKQIMP